MAEFLDRIPGMNRLLDSIRSRGEIVVDTVIAVALALFAAVQMATVPLFFHRPGEHGPRGPFDADRGPFFIRETLARPVDYLLILVCFLPLALRRRYPLTVLGVTTLAAAIFSRSPHPPTIAFIAPLIALYTVGTLKDRRTLVTAALVAAVVALVLTLPSFADTRFFTEAMRIVAMYAGAAALGAAVRNQRAYVTEVEMRYAEAERTREEEARRRVDEERLRIARELHDVTAHSLSVIAVQAGAAERVLFRDPGSAAHALVAIRETASKSLDELRSLVGVLRGAGEDVSGQRAPREPQPSLLGLPDLVKSVRDAGISVSLDVPEDFGELPAFVDLSAFRIIQEALTNVMRHAEATEVRLTVRRENNSLAIEVEDNGTGATGEPNNGHGINGMAERVAALDGVFEAGPRPEGGFRVYACLPIARRGTAASEGREA